MTKIRLFKYIMRITGLVCIGLSLTIFLQFKHEETTAKVAASKISQAMTSQPNTKPVASEDFAMAVQAIDGVAYIGQIRIPSQKLLLPIAATYSFDQISRTPALYQGSYYNNDMVICAHNYVDHFAALEHLSVGETLTVETVDGQVITYVITNKEIIQPTQVKAIDKTKPNQEWDLTLFTCTPSGLQRLLVRCERV